LIKGDNLTWRRADLKCGRKIPIRRRFGVLYSLRTWIKWNLPITIPWQTVVAPCGWTIIYTAT